MKSAILAIIFPLAAAAAALTPSTIKDDIPGTATIDEIVTAGGSARPADVRRIVDASFNGGTQEVNRVTGAFDGTVGRLDAVKRDRTDLKVYRKVKDCWTWTNWSNPQEPDAKEAPADFIALANSPGSEPIHFERGAWWGAVQFWPNGKVKYSQSEIPPGGTGELSTSVNFAMYAYDETGTNEIYRFGATATRTDPTNETVVAWDGTRNQYVRVATTDMVDDSIRREVTQATNALVRSVNGKAGDVNLTAEDVGAVAKDDKIVVIGFEAEATPTSTWSVVVGPGAVASNKCSVALGINATASHAHSVSLGQSATSSGIGGISIGTGSRADSQMPTVAIPAIAIGYNAHADSGHAMAIGSSASATNLGATALGERANANGYCSTAVGANAMTKGDHAIAIGISKATNNYSVAIGHGAASHGERTFNVNPEGGASGFYIGSLTLADLFGQKVDYAGEYQNVRKAALQSRAIDDFGVYAPTDFSDFTWDGYRTDALEAIGNTQPYFSGLGYDEGEWECDFYMDGHRYYGYYYGTSNDRTIEMDFHAEWYDDEEPWEWHDDYLTLVATRDPTGWDFDNQIDVIVKNSDLSGIRSDISVLDTRIDSLEGAIRGETKVMRTGKEGEHGVGYGYVSTDPKTGNRKWRLRVPNFSSRSGLSTNATGYTNYRPLNYSGGYANLYTYYQATYPLSFANMWSVKMDVIRTSEPYGSDAVNAADYRFSFITTATNLPAARHILSFDVRQVSTSPRIFHVTPVTNDLIRTVREYWTNPTRTTARDSKSSEVLYYADVPPGMGGTGLFYTSGSTQYRETFTVSAVYVRNATLVSTNSFTLPFLVRLGSDTVTYGSTTISANDKFVEQKAVVNVASGATFMNVTVPYYKQVTTLNSGLFYDEKRRCTWRMRVVDGHPVTEIYSETDWRED